MPLTERQDKAKHLADELEKLGGCWVITPLPLDPDTKGLRVQILSTDRDRVITALCEARWNPIYLQQNPRFTTNGGLVPGFLYEVEIPKERQPIVDDTPKIPSDAAELAKREEEKKTRAFIASFRKSAGLDR
jgi:hypothetical protein